MGQEREGLYLEKQGINLWIELVDGLRDLSDSGIQELTAGDENKFCEGPEHVGDILRVELRQLCSSFLSQCWQQRTPGLVLQLCKSPEHVCYILGVEPCTFFHSLFGKAFHQLGDGQEIQGGEGPDDVCQLLSPAGLQLIACQDCELLEALVLENSLHNQKAY